MKNEQDEASRGISDSQRGSGNPEPVFWSNSISSALFVANNTGHSVGTIEHFRLFKRSVVRDGKFKREWGLMHGKSDSHVKTAFGRCAFGLCGGRCKWQFVDGCRINKRQVWKGLNARKELFSRWNSCWFYFKAFLKETIVEFLEYRLSSVTAA